MNLTELALTVPGKASNDSKYRRLRRLFKEFKIDFSLVARFIAEQLPYEKFTLCLDRTNWKFGKLNINILCLAIVHQGVAIPILWMLLPKKGNSNTAERIQLMERFIALFGIDRIECLLADREFVGRNWAAYLIKNKVKFRIRIKENTKISRIHGGVSKARNFFRNLAPGEYAQLRGARTIWGEMVYVTGGRLFTGEYLLIMSPDEGTQEILGDYKKRWEIETLFKALKTKGFNLEETHLTNLDRIDKLLATLAIAFYWAHCVGEWLQEQKPIPIKAHQRRARSVFRYGLDHLRSILLHITDKIDDLFHAVGLLSKGVSRVLTN